MVVGAGLQFRGVEGNALVAVVPVRVEENHRPGREVHPRRHGGRGEHGVQVALLHHRLHGKFPGRELAAVVGANAEAAHGCQLLVLADVRKPFEEFG